MPAQGRPDQLTLAAFLLLVVLAGFYIEAPSVEDAREWAARTSAAINMPREVRPFVGMRAT